MFDLPNRQKKLLTVQSVHVMMWQMLIEHTDVA
jgi:hypothetical protein